VVVRGHYGWHVHFASENEADASAALDPNRNRGGPVFLGDEDRRAWLAGRGQDAVDAWKNTLDLNTYQLQGIVEWSPEDQVVKVRAGTWMEPLQDELKCKGQCLPLPPRADWPVILCDGVSSVGGCISMNMPHVLEAQSGSWRDWVLGMTVVLADGRVVRCGSSAVKNVAGYDVQKLFVGARGTLGVITDITLKTYPIATLPKPNVTFLHDQPEDENRVLNRGWWIQRTQRSDFQQAVRAAGERAWAADNASCTLWARVESRHDLPRYPHDWVLRSLCGTRNVEVTDAAKLALMRRAKEIFDPTHKFMRGVFGIS
jgi:FAD/FMN-containing dehydrogenase